MTAFVDSNVLIRHLTGEPQEQAARAFAALRSAETLVLVDLIVAEMFVLASVYEVERSRVAELVRAILGFPTISVADTPLLLRTLELYEQQHIHFAEAYLAACAEYSGVGRVMSFDRESDRVHTVEQSPLSTIRRLDFAAWRLRRGHCAARLPAGPRYAGSAGWTSRPGASGAATARPACRRAFQSSPWAFV